MSVRLRPGVLVASVACLLISAAPVAQRIPGVGRFVVPPAQSSPSTCTPNMAADATPTQVNTEYSNAADGGTLCFAAGSYSWGTLNGGQITLNGSKGITLQCETQNACDVTYDGGGHGTFQLPTVTLTTKLYRISGFEFTAQGEGDRFITVCAGGNCNSNSTHTMTQLRVDHNTFHFSGNTQIILTASDSEWRLYGVFDHNTFDVTSMDGHHFLLPTRWDSTDLPTRALGSANNLFFEDNVFTAGAYPNTSSGSWKDGWGPGDAVVWRFNTMTGGRILAHADNHQYGTTNLEAYGNVWNHNGIGDANGYHTVQHQGSGTFAVWGNEITHTGTRSTEPFSIQNYRGFQPNGDPECDGDGDPSGSLDGNRSPEATWRGYPCYHQAGRDFDGVLFPVFTFLNYWTDSASTIGNLSIATGGGCCSPDYSTVHLVNNRDSYLSSSNTANTCSSHSPNTGCSPFDGTTGIGHGPLAERPSTCTVGPEADTGEADEGKGGVMYWATDQGSWNASSSNPYGVQRNGADGVLYMCTATNTWSVYYTPYTYPHPLNN